MTAFRLTLNASTLAIALGVLAPASAAAQDVDVEWQACTLTAQDSTSAECALAFMPLRRNAAENTELIGVAVKRWLSDQPLANADGRRTQFWYFAGGPGDSGLEAMGRLHGLLGDFGIDLYTLDHRGVGASGVLACPEQQAPDGPEGAELTPEEWSACMEYLRATRSDLDALTADAAARDAGALIDAVRGNDRVFVFGASYGSYWVNRYLMLFPNQPDGVILDGIVPADWSFAEFDEGLELAGRRIMARCAGSPECSAHLGPDPVAVAAALPARFDEGHCPDLDIDGRTVRLLLGNMLMSGTEVVPYLPVMVYRMNRCKLRDLLAIGSLFERLFESGESGVEIADHAPVMQRHVSMSELWPDPGPDPDALTARSVQTAMSTEVSVSFARTWADWPRYPRPSNHGVQATYNGPLLMLHGGLDPTMPMERLAAIRQAYAGANQTFVAFPELGHVAVNDSACARALYRAFLTDPGAELDVSCVAQEPSLSLDHAPDTERWSDGSLFGTDDFWGDRMAPLEKQLLGGGLAVVALLALLTFWLVRRWRRRRLLAC